MADEPRLEWAFETKGKIYASPILADLDNDGSTEVIVCASRDKRVICLDAEGGLLWDYRLHDAGTDGIQATPSVVDYDGDGNKEVFFVDTGGVAGCLDSKGTLIWRVFTGDKTDYSGPVVADLDGDGHIEIVFGSDSGTVYCIDDCGIELWHYQGNGQIRGIPAVAYHEPSGTMRIYATFGGGTATCFDSNGRVVWSYDERAPRNERRSGPAVGDVDGDGRPEVILATEDFQVIVRDAFSGTEKWRWKGKGKIDSTNSFALADFDGTGRLDIVCADGTGQGGTGHVYRLRDGEPLWATEVGAVVQGPSVGDVDGDGELEILVTSRTRRLVCLSADGAEEWSYPTKTGTLTTPALGDIDGDGETEIVFTSKDRFVYCVTVGGTYNSARMPWPMMNHDAQLSGNAANIPFEATSAPKQVAEFDLHLRAFDMKEMDMVGVAFTNNSHRPRHLEVVVEVRRPDGSLVTQTVTDRFEPYQSETTEFEVPLLEPGEYVAEARLVDVGTGKTLATREKRQTITPLAQEDRDVRRLILEAGSIETHMGREAGQRSDDALDAMKPMVERFEEARDSVGRKDASLKERRKAVETARETVRHLARHVARMRAAAMTPGEAVDFAVVPETTLRKVFMDEPYLGERIDPEIPDPATPSISLARNELEGVQIVVVPLWKDLENLRLSVSDLTHADGTATISREQVTVHRIGYVTIGQPEYNFLVEKEGLWPDITFPAEPVDVPGNQDAQPFFVTVHADDAALSGDYAGTIRVEADGCQAFEMPLHVHVWDFGISKETHLKTSFWLSENWLRRFYNYEGRTPWEVRRRFYDYQLSHRAGALKDFPMDRGERLKDLEYLIENGQNNFFIPLPEKVDEANRPEFAEMLRETRAFIKQKGWDDRALFYTRDEVAVMARHLIPQVVELNQWVHSIVPEWPRLQTSAPEQALFDGVDIWCPTIDHFDEVILAERMAQGDRLWLYTVWGRPGIMIEFPATDHRLMFWQCWKYGAEGFLYWGTTHWDLNTVGEERWPAVPWIPWNRQPGHNGCGYLIYPGPDGTPIGSIRFELIRDGIEDYEYLYLLRERLAAQADRAPEELRKRAEAELAIAPEVLADHKTFTENPEAILAARARIARVIEELDRVR